MRYKNISKEKETGAIYTPTEMAKYLANEIIKHKEYEQSSLIRILDPAVGMGELLIAMLESLIENIDVPIEVIGYETDSSVSKSTQETLNEMFPAISIDIRNEDFLEAVDKGNIGIFDYVIANPPYIRTQILGSEKSQEISNKLGLSGKIDIYYAFILSTKKILKDKGIAGFITSNKFFTIKSGETVRNYILDNYYVHRITDLGDTKLFNASVLPAIIVFSKGKTVNNNDVKYTSVYQINSGDKHQIINSIFEAIYKSGIYTLPCGISYCFKQGVLQSTEKDALWNIQSTESINWLAEVERNTWLRFSDVGKIRVGIKTTADNVFIGENWSGEEANIELLRPLITHRNAGQIIPNNADHWQVLYTHTSINGRKMVVDIEDYPNAKKYLLKHYKQLASRKYIQKANRNWYEIWVPQNPDSWKKTKIVFRDISEHPEFWIDTTGAVVNGDCYWIDINDDVVEDIVFLILAVANSEFIEKYYDLKFNTKLYSGKRRFMSQYVEQFPLPFYSTDLAQQAISVVKKIIAENDNNRVLSYKKELNKLVYSMFIQKNQ